jgi:hypothetical protein
VSESEHSRDELAQGFSRLDIGMLVVLVSMAIAGVVGLIAVLDAGDGLSALAIGFGITWFIVLGGATMACGLACLARRRLEPLALGSLVAAGLAVDLVVLAIWLEIDSKAYGQLVGVAFVGALFGLAILGLSLACRPRDALATWLYYGAVGASLLGAVLAAALILTTGGEDFESSGELFDVVPVGFTNDGLLRPLAASLVVAAALWFAALAASRVERTADA